MVVSWRSYAENDCQVCVYVCVYAGVYVQRRSRFAAYSFNMRQRSDAAQLYEVGQLSCTVPLATFTLFDSCKVN